MELSKICVQSEWEAAFLLCSSLTSIVRLKCSTTENVCSKQAGGCFLVYLLLISIVHQNVSLPKMCLQASRGLIFSLFIFNQYCTAEVFYYKFYKTSVKGCFLNWCFLVHWANFIKLLLLIYLVLKLLNSA